MEVHGCCGSGFAMSACSGLWNSNTVLFVIQSFYSTKLLHNFEIFSLFDWSSIPFLFNKTEVIFYSNDCGWARDDSNELDSECSSSLMRGENKTKVLHTLILVYIQLNFFLVLSFYMCSFALSYFFKLIVYMMLMIFVTTFFICACDIFLFFRSQKMSLDIVHVILINYSFGRKF